MSKYEKRDSPSVSAQDFPNKIKEGNDGEEYVSRADKNKVYRWYKIKSMDKCSTAEKYYMQFPENYLQKKFYKYDLKILETKIKRVKKELEKKKIYLFKIGWKKAYNFIDYAWEDAREHNKENFIFYTEKVLFWAQNSGELTLQWSLQKGVKEDAFEIFHKIFKNKFVKPKRAENAIVLFA